MQNKMLYTGGDRGRHDIEKARETGKRQRIINPQNVGQRKENRYE